MPDAQLFRMPLARMPAAVRDLVELLGLEPADDVCAAALEEIRRLRSGDTRRLIELVDLAEAVTGVLALLDRDDIEIQVKDHVSDKAHQQLNALFNERFALLRKRAAAAPPTPWVK